jgi:hypothetical protein
VVPSFLARFDHLFRAIFEAQRRAVPDGGRQTQKSIPTRLKNARTHIVDRLLVHFEKKFRARNAPRIVSRGRSIQVIMRATVTSQRENER